MRDKSLQNMSIHMIFPIFIILTFIILWRGHHLPGGGFIAGLIAATALILKESAGHSRFSGNVVQFLYNHGMSLGLGIAFLSAMTGLALKGNFFTAVWLPELTILNLKIHLGTPLLFDLGVFVTVTSFCLTSIHSFKGAE